VVWGLTCTIHFHWSDEQTLSGPMTTWHRDAGRQFSVTFTFSSEGTGRFDGSTWISGLFIDVNKSDRGYVAVRNDVKAACWRALRDAAMTFSTDVTTGLVINSVPSLEVSVESKG